MRAPSATSPIMTLHLHIRSLQVMGMLPEELRNGVAVSINGALFSRVAIFQQVADPLDRAQARSAGCCDGVEHPLFTRDLTNMYMKRIFRL